MKRLRREHLFCNRGDFLPVLPEPPLRVALGETFEIETADCNNKNIQSPADINKPPGPFGTAIPWTGPVYVEGIKAGDVIAVHIEDIRVTDNCFLSIGEFSPVPTDMSRTRLDYVSITDNTAHFPGGVDVPIRPMYGCFGVVPLQYYAETWQHGGNMDIPDIRAGNIVHVRCERDGAFFACGDGHALQGDGEVNGFSLEVSTLGRLRIEKSPYQDLKTILIESPDELITVGIRHEMKAAVTDAVGAMASLLAQQRGIDFLDAYQVVSHVGNIRLGAMWPMWCERWHIAVPACLHLSRDLFAKR